MATRKPLTPQEEPNSDVHFNNNFNTVVGIENTPFSGSPQPASFPVVDTSGGFISWVTEVPASMLPPTTPSGPAGGDLSGTYPNPTVSNIDGIPVSTTPPTDGQVQAYSASAGQYVPATIPGVGGINYPPLNVISSNTVTPTLTSYIVSSYLEILSGITFEVGVGGFLEILN